MTKFITITLAALALVVVSSCSTSTTAPQQSMPGMSAQEHANMKKGGSSMSGMKM